MREATKMFQYQLMYAHITLVLCFYFSYLSPNKRAKDFVSCHQTPEIYIDISIYIYKIMQTGICRATLAVCYGETARTKLPHTAEKYLHKQKRTYSVSAIPYLCSPCSCLYLCFSSNIVLGFESFSLPFNKSLVEGQGLMIPFHS